MKKILFALMCASALVILAGCSNEKELEENAVPVVNQIMEDEFADELGKENLTKCTKVDLEKKISDNKWSGKAYFDNGREIDCIVTDLDDMIRVEIDFNTFR